jgi:hypothetical protein
MSKIYRMQVKKSLSFEIELSNHFQGSDRKWVVLILKAVALYSIFHISCIIFFLKLRSPNRNLVRIRGHVDHLRAIERAREREKSPFFASP